MRRNLCAALVLGTLSAPIVTSAQGLPLGSEFQINTYTTDQQHAPAVALDGAGNFVVVWHSSGQDGDNSGVFGRRFTSNGVAVGTEFQVNTYTTDFQGYAAVGSDSAGNFTVVWTSGCGNNQDGDLCGLFGQRFSNAGARLGTEFQVNTYTTGYQDGSAIAMDAGGSFVVVWESRYGQDGDDRGVFGQRFSSTGGRLGTEFQVNTYTTGYQGTYPLAVASSPSGFVVAWQSTDQDGDSYGIFGQRFDTNGTRQGTEFQVNSYTTGGQQDPAIATDAAGNFVVVWLSGGQDGDSSGVFGQRFSSLGARIGTEFQVNTYTSGYQGTYPSSLVAADAAGNFVVVWISRLQDGSNDGVFGQRFSNSGARLGTEFQVNTYTTNQQNYPTVVSTAAGNFVVAWQSYQDGSERGIFAQRFGSIAAAPPAAAAPAVGRSGLVVLGLGLILVGGVLVVRRQRRA